MLGSFAGGASTALVAMGPAAGRLPRYYDDGYTTVAREKQGLKNSDE
jgi:hypothetical protein